MVLTCAPVKVAMSTMMSAPRSLQAYDTPSASTSLPSASVLLISTVLGKARTQFRNIAAATEQERSHGTCPPQDYGAPYPLGGTTGGGVGRVGFSDTFG